MPTVKQIIRSLAIVAVLVLPVSSYASSYANGLYANGSSAIGSGADEPGPAAIAACGPEGTQENGALYVFCLPPNWDGGDLIVYAHGYVAPDEPLANQLTLPDGTSIANAVQFLGYAFATTSYSHNGLAVLDGVESVTDLVEIFSAQHGAPSRVFLVGVSQGGLVATLALEQNPSVFTGGLALCGPYGDFDAQLDYFTDARVLFDYFFPDLLPESPITIPQTLYENWESTYEDSVKPALLDETNAAQVDQLLATARIPYDQNPNDELSDAAAKAEAIRGVLWYNVIATNDAMTRLGGQPYDNQDRAYSGSDDDTALNQNVQRFSADPAAVAEVATRYLSTGNLRVPMVTLHTTQDPIVPYNQAALYKERVDAQERSDYYDHIEADGYGHCRFTQSQVLTALNRLQAMVNTLPPYVPTIYLPLVNAGSDSENQ